MKHITLNSVNPTQANLESLQTDLQWTNGFHIYLIFDSYLVNVYSLSPEWRFMAEKVPMQPRSRLSRPVFHVTKSGLKRQKNRRNPPASTDIWFLREDNQGTKETLCFPSSKPQRAGWLTCCLTRTKLHAHTPHMQTPTLPSTFSAHSLLSSSSLEVLHGHLPGQTLSSNEWSGYLIPLSVLASL